MRIKIYKHHFLSILHAYFLSLSLSLSINAEPCSRSIAQDLSTLEQEELEGRRHRTVANEVFLSYTLIFFFFFTEANLIKDFLKGVSFLRQLLLHLMFPEQKFRAISQIANTSELSAFLRISARTFLCADLRNSRTFNFFLTFFDITLKFTSLSSNGWNVNDVLRRVEGKHVCSEAKVVGARLR